MKTFDLKMDSRAAATELGKWKKGNTPQDQLIKKAYRALARGGKLIDLHQSFQIAGCDANGRPALAFGRADATEISLTTWGNDGISFRSNVGRHPDYIFPRILWPGLVTQSLSRVAARVPIIPPDFRRSNLSQYRILFEAAWNEITDDPMLLEPLGGSLYRVVAHWDLTIIEQAVLRGGR